MWPWGLFETSKHDDQKPQRAVLGFAQRRRVGRSKKFPFFCLTSVAREATLFVDILCNSKFLEPLRLRPAPYGGQNPIKNTALPPWGGPRGAPRQPSSGKLFKGPQKINAPKTSKRPWLAESVLNGVVCWKPQNQKLGPAHSQFSTKIRYCRRAHMAGVDPLIAPPKFLNFKEI